MEIGQRY